MLPTPSSIHSILIVRTDSIGDALLGNSILPPLGRHFPNAKITVCCQAHTAELYQSCAFVSQVIPFDKKRAYADEPYRNQILAQLQSLHADLALCPVSSREPLSDIFTLDSAATHRIGFNGNLPDLLPDHQKNYNNKRFTHLVEIPHPFTPELERLRLLLESLSIAHRPLAPQIWLTREDHAAADRLLEEHHLDLDRTPGLALFAAAQSKERINRHFGHAIAPLAAKRKITVLAMGSAHEFAVNQPQLDIIAAAGGKTVNLCGQTTLRQMAAILYRCALAVGAETGTAHLACAVDIRNVVVLGGGHFGRFMPYTPLTTVACLPLSCYHCDWHCRFPQAHCVHDVAPPTIERAVLHGLDAPYPTPTIFVQQSHASATPEAAPLQNFFDTSRFDIIPVPAPQPAAKNPSPTPLRLIPAPNPQFKVSAIVSVYKSEKFIRGCLEDLVAQSLFQQNELEIVVIDSASPENEQPIIQEFLREHPTQIQYLRTPQRETLYAAWNRAIRLARGKFLTNANTDDRHHPLALEKMAAALAANPKAALVYADSDITQEPNAPWQTAARTGKFEWPEFDSEGLFETCYIGPHPMWRRDIHTSLGYFDATMSSAGDYEFWLRISLKHPFVHLAETLGLYLENPNSISLSNINQSWHESETARDRYWDPARGPHPKLKRAMPAFAKLKHRVEAELKPHARVALYGAGKHTTRMLHTFKNACEPHAHLVAILDDNPKNENVQGVPVTPTANWRELSPDAIIVSSDTFEAAMAQRLQSTLQNAIPIWRVYGN